MGDDRLSRSSDPARYRPLIDAAERELARLEREFDVVRSESKSLDPQLVSVSGRGKLVRLTPRAGGGAPVTVFLADDPESDLRYSLTIRLGRWYTNNMPRCGCDYCFEEGAESVEGFVDELLFDLCAVSEGHYVERMDGTNGAYVRLSVSADRWKAAKRPVVEMPPPGIPEPPPEGWGAWVRRIA